MFKRHTKPILAALALLLVAGCVGSQKQIAGETVDFTYRSYKLSWRHDGAFILFRYTAKDVDGMVAICGAYAESKGGRMSDFTPLTTARGFVEMDGERMLTGIDFFASHGQEPSIAGKASRCVVTNNPWKPSYSRGKAQLDFPRGGYKIT